MSRAFERRLGVGSVSEADYAEAAKAMRLEHDANSAILALQAFEVRALRPVDDRIYAVTVARVESMHWTWEGSSAYRHGLPAWDGDVVAVDAAQSTIFIKVRPMSNPPCKGKFHVRPFDFIAALDSVYNGQMAALMREPVRNGLAGALGSLHTEERSARIEDSQGRRAWNVSWGFLWGPPGTGKTYSIGRHVAQAIDNPNERILVVSTTNKATDGVALSIAGALERRGLTADRQTLSRLGVGADITKFEEANCASILVGGEAWLRRRISSLKKKHAQTADPELRARMQAELQSLFPQASEGSGYVYDCKTRIVVTTAFSAIRTLSIATVLSDIGANKSTFSTVIIDEAGLVSRLALAALSLLASRRVLVVGDPKQLSPISRISRVLPSSQARWLASSGMEHLATDAPRQASLSSQKGVLLLTRQYRMHSQIREAVSAYQYGSKLEDADEIERRTSPSNRIFGPTRAIWYVLDEDAEDPAKIRAQRGPGNRSWVRERSIGVLNRLFRAFPSLKEQRGLFISPFSAQAKAVSDWLSHRKIQHWRASTVHKQQGAEAEIVVFDTVNASSTAWPHAEWKRLVNVGMSRAREMMILLSSRAEMAEPFLRELESKLAPRVLRGSGGRLRWEDVRVLSTVRNPSKQIRRLSPSCLGAQIEARKALRPILSAEQQRLCGYALDGKPRLVRGVAGSGKTAVMAHWLCRLMARGGQQTFWVVYANAALLGLIRKAIATAWLSLDEGASLPWQSVRLMHVADVLSDLERTCGLPRAAKKQRYDFNARANALRSQNLEPRCDALFIDEAQDFGPATIALLTSLVRPSSHGDDKIRCVNIFYDNAQNVYGRGTPKWSELGLSMRGRSTVMKQSFRSTRPNTEFALNVLYQLRPPDNDADHGELVDRALVERGKRSGRDWWTVRFNHVEGPNPDFRKYKSRKREIAEMCARIDRLVDKEGVRPSDIRIVAQDRFVRADIVKQLDLRVRKRNIKVEEQIRQRFDERDDTIIVTTPHSFKGYEAEVVFVPAADRYVAHDAGAKRVLPEVLYVAMTRARSILCVSAIERPDADPGAPIVRALQSCIESLKRPGAVSSPTSARDVENEIIARIGEEHRKWYRKIATSHGVETGPLCSADGSPIAEPVFWYRALLGACACFAVRPSSEVQQQLKAEGFVIVEPGGGSL